MIETGKSRVLYGMVYKLLAETEEENFYSLWLQEMWLGYTSYVATFELSNVESDSHSLAKRSSDWKSWSKFITTVKKACKWYFVGWWVCCNKKSHG